MIWHVTPVNDLKPHEEKSTCHCQPVCEVLPEGDMIIIHNALDGRK